MRAMGVPADKPGEPRPLQARIRYNDTGRVVTVTGDLSGSFVRWIGEIGQRMDIEAIIEPAEDDPLTGRE